jgi:dihydropteroate synthase
LAFRLKKKMIRQLLRKHKRTIVMGVLNVTPDSFSDGGKFFNVQSAIKRGIVIVKEGADIIDIGGESTRPGAKCISVASEIDRVIPVIRALRRKTRVPISVDTRKSEVAREAIRAGADIINDVSGLRFDPGMARIAAKYKTGIILMHSKGDPETMQRRPSYRDVVKEIIQSLKASMAIALEAGVKKDRIALDPGIGFGKTVSHNLEILKRLDEICRIGRPVCIGTSRKSFIGKVLGLNRPEERLAGTLASSVLAISKGASIVRVHDVKEMVMACRMTDAILKNHLTAPVIPPRLA